MCRVRAHLSRAVCLGSAVACRDLPFSRIAGHHTVIGVCVNCKCKVRPAPQTVTTWLTTLMRCVCIMIIDREHLHARPLPRPESLVSLSRSRSTATARATQRRAATKPQTLPPAGLRLGLGLGLRSSHENLASASSHEALGHRLRRLLVGLDVMSHERGLRMAFGGRVRRRRAHGAHGASMRPR